MGTLKPQNFLQIQLTINLLVFFCFFKRCNSWVSLFSIMLFLFFICNFCLAANNEQSQVRLVLPEDKIINLEKKQMCLTYLMIKYHFPPSICFVKDIKLIQHDWIIKHILDNILSHDASNLNIIIKDIFYFLLFNDKEKTKIFNKNYLPDQSTWM